MKPNYQFHQCSNVLKVSHHRLFTKPAFQIFENPANSKSTAAAVNIKQRAFKVIGLCVKHYGYMYGKSYGCFAALENCY